ncbi:hypothetical protein HN587_05235 [Candidatus Woesearchaeota archaeon]|jgi:HTH-type transcriptional regulator, sugar sensing transcriptional regulator|nr:hypothetical protein [Candidatus Woesearchaeota archaeon]
MELSQVLDSLNLNKYEKETILYLSTVDSASAKDIYKNTQVPKGRIYSIIQELKEYNFVKVIPTSPKTYKIEDIKDSLKLFINQKKENLNNKLTQIDNLGVIPKKFNIKKKDPSVLIFTGRDEHMNALIFMRSSAKKELIQIAPLFVGKYSSNLALYKALNRKVKVKIIIKKITSQNKKNVTECILLGADIRQLNSPELLSLLIKDNQEFLLGVQDHRREEERLTLFSKNPALLESLQATFIKLWKKANKVNI